MTTNAVRRHRAAIEALASASDDEFDVLMEAIRVTRIALADARESVGGRRLYASERKAVLEGLVEASS